MKAWYLPQRIGDLRDRRTGDEQLPGGVGEGVLHVPRRESPGVHLGDQALQDVGVAVPERHEARAVGLFDAPHLGDPDRHLPFGGAEAPGLRTVAPAALVPASSLVAAPASQVVSLFGFEQLLDHQSSDGVDQSRDDVGPLSGTAVKQAIEFLADEHGRRYSPHWPGPPCR